VLLVVGIVVTPLAGWLLLSRFRADLALSLLGVAALPVLVWAASLGAELGPCGVPDCMSSAQHSQLVVSIVALVILVGSFVLLALGHVQWGGIVLTIAQLVGAFSLLKTDLAASVMLIIFAALAASYVTYQFLSSRETTRIPDFPPTA
jgi:hypothetical protein